MPSSSLSKASGSGRARADHRDQTFSRSLASSPG